MRQLTMWVGGATGFVGSQLVAHLSAHYPQVQVRALTRTPESDTARHFAALPLQNWIRQYCSNQGRG